MPKESLFWIKKLLYKVNILNSTIYKSYRNYFLLAFIYSIVSCMNYNKQVVSILFCTVKELISSRNGLVNAVSHMTQFFSSIFYNIFLLIIITIFEE